MQATPHHRRRAISLRKRTILPAAIASLLPAIHSPAATVSWAVDSNGTWTTPSNWSTNTLPGPDDDVTINRPNSIYAVTLSSDAQSINSLTSYENLTVSGGSLAIATTAQIGGTLTLNGGTLIGGTWTTTGNGTITASGTLSGVTLGGNLTVPNSKTLTVTNGLTLAGGTITLSPTNSISYLNFSGTQTLGGTGTIFLGGLANSYADSITSSGALTIAQGVTIANTYAQFGTSPYAAIDLGPSGLNQGTISSQTSSRSITVTGTNWINAGTLSATNGGRLTVDGDGSWTNTGILTVGSDSSLDLYGSWSSTGTMNVSTGGALTLYGAFTTAGIGTLSNNGTVTIRGTLDNTGNTLTLDRTAFSLNNSGTIIGGTVNTTSTGATVYGTLSGVTLGGKLIVPDGMLTVTKGLTLAGGTITLGGNYNSYLTFSGAQTLGGTGTILFVGPYPDSIMNSAPSSPSESLTVAPGVTIANSSSGSGSITFGFSGVNQGTISSQVSGKTITISGTAMSNAGLFEARNGGALTVSQTPSNFAAGKLTGGTWAVYAGSTLRVSGAAITTNAATILLDGTGSNFYSSTSGTTNALSGLASNQGSFTITNGRNFTAASNFANSGTLTVGPSSALTVPGTLTNTGTLVLIGSLTTPGGSLNLAAGTVLYDYTSASPADSVRQLLFTGRANGGWTGSGITSSPAASDPAVAIGYAEASLLLNLSGSQTAIWSGQIVDATTLLLKATLTGDANMNGTVDSDDYALLDRSLAVSRTNARWTDGDFDYDGAITSADYILIDSTYLQQQGGAPSPSFLSQRESQFGPTYVSELLAAVPEPSSFLALFGVVFVGLRKRF